MSITQENICNYCRTCMKQLDSLKFDLFSKSNELQWLSIFNFLEITIEMNRLPRYLCKICHEKLVDILEFREICLKTTRKYCEMINLTCENNDYIKIEPFIEIEKTEKEDSNFEGTESTTDNIYSVNESVLNNTEMKEDTNDELEFGNCETSFADPLDEEVIETQEIVKTDVKKKSKKKTKRKKIVRKLKKNQSNKSDNDDLESSCKDGFKQNCKVCGKVFLHKINYEACMRRHQGLKPYPCPNCEKGYSKMFDLRTHIKAHHSDNPPLYPCPIKDCGITYKILYTLRKHCQTVHRVDYNSITNQNAECDKDDKDDKDEKETENEGNVDSETCELCLKKHKTEYNREMCIKKHAGIKCHVCQICEKSFLTSLYLKRHIICRHTESSSIEKCSFEGCERTFNNKISLEYHYKSTHLRKSNNTERTFICPECGKSFNRNDRLQRHVSMHTGIFPYKCEKCPSKGFNTLSKLKDHLNRHAGIKNFACEFCAYRSVTDRELRAHKNLHHVKTEDRTQYNCSYCEFKTFHKFQVKQHENIIHHGIRNFKCQYCYKSFGKSQKLKLHIMTHTGERPQKCTLCPKSFIQSQALKIHLRAHANGRARIT